MTPFLNHRDTCWWAKQAAVATFSAVVLCDTGESIALHRVTVTKSDYNTSGWGWGFAE